MDDQIQRKSFRVYALALALSVSVALFVSLIYSDGFGRNRDDFREDLLSTKSSDLSIAFGTDNAADIQELKQGLGLEKPSDDVVDDDLDASPVSSDLVQGLGLDKDPDSAVSASSDAIDDDASSSGSIGAKAASTVDEFLHFNSDLTAPPTPPESASSATSATSAGAQGHSGLSFAHNMHALLPANGLPLPTIGAAFR